MLQVLQIILVATRLRSLVFASHDAVHADCVAAENTAAPAAGNIDCCWPPHDPAPSLATSRPTPTGRAPAATNSGSSATPAQHYAPPHSRRWPRPRTHLYAGHDAHHVHQLGDCSRYLAALPRSAQCPACAVMRPQRPRIARASQTPQIFANALQERLVARVALAGQRVRVPLGVLAAVAFGCPATQNLFPPGILSFFYRNTGKYGEGRAAGQTAVTEHLASCDMLSPEGSLLLTNE
ncbi:hypothetical protein SPI_07928 [Niveomyces insectorum RCEF 264]|uniref:Uncharacterized protein n=1 Tax=Niveomyces insectorum RCEF 264 TaxID=1081102 RepID=A0A167P5M0_9HYPO|nr:hypothetical protein SPI_07928 [Niveomyces insectorum RCEF 264]